MCAMQKILIYGVGNPFRCDDAVGLKVAERLKKELDRPNIVVKSGSIDGLAILNEILGYDRVIFIDSLRTDKGTPGDIYRIILDPLNTTPSLSVSHGIDFTTALRMGKKLGYSMPKNINVYAVEIEDNTSFSEECTEKVTASIPTLVERIVKEVKEIDR